MAVIGALVVFVAVKLGILPVPLAANPMEGLLFCHAKVVPATGLSNAIAGAVFEFAYVRFDNTLLVCGVGFTVIA